MCLGIINDACYDIKREGRKNVPVRFESKTLYRLINPEQKLLSKVSFDLCNEAQSTCCDYLFIVEYPDKHRYIFVELKSSDVAKAVEQIFESINKYKQCLVNKTIDGRIITTKTYPPDLVSSGYMRLRKSLRRSGGDLLTKSKQFEEEI